MGQCQSAFSVSTSAQTDDVSRSKKVVSSTHDRKAFAQNVVHDEEPSGLTMPTSSGSTNSHCNMPRTTTPAPPATLRRFQSNKNNNGGGGDRRKKLVKENSWFHMTYMKDLLLESEMEEQDVVEDRTDSGENEDHHHHPLLPLSEDSDVMSTLSNSSWGELDTAVQIEKSKQKHQT